MIRTFTYSLAVSALFPILCLGQTKGTAPSTVSSNPRSSSDDPRTGLKAGLYDAGEAIFGLVKLASLPKPPGFAPGNFFPNLQPPPEPDEPLKPGEPPRAPVGQYGSANSDLAFSGNHVFVGNYNGINFYDIDNPAKVKLTASLVCPGGQGDVSVYGHLMFMSAEAVNARLDCGTHSAARSGAMHSRKGREMHVPKARRACRRSISQDCDRMLLIAILLVIVCESGPKGPRLARCL